MINRSPSTISRELRRNREACGTYSTHGTQQHMLRRRQACRPRRKLLPGSERFELVAHMLRERFSPEQIAGKLHGCLSSSRSHYLGDALEWPRHEALARIRKLSRRALADKQTERFTGDVMIMKVIWG